MTNSQGWVRIHRQFIEWEWYSDINTKVLFIHLILKANHKDNKYKGKVVKRGSLVTGRKLLSMEVGLSEQQVRTSLHKLKSTNEITIKTSKKGTIIQVVNYDKYQAAPNESTNNQPTGNQQVTTNNNDNNDNKIIPSIEDFVNHGVSVMEDVSIDHLKAKYHSWVNNGWKDGNDKEIKRWKAKLSRTLPYLPKQPKAVRNLDQEFYDNVMKQVNANK